MAVFMQGQHIGPENTAEVKIIRCWCEKKFAAEWPKRHISIGNGCLIMQYDTDFVKPVADRGRFLGSQVMHYRSNPPGLTVKAGRKNYSCRIAVDLFPF